MAYPIYWIMDRELWARDAVWGQSKLRSFNFLLWLNSPKPPSPSCARSPPRRRHSAAPSGPTSHTLRPGPAPPVGHLRAPPPREGPPPARVAPQDRAPRAQARPRDVIKIAAEGLSSFFFESIIGGFASTCRAFLQKPVLELHDSSSDPSLYSRMTIKRRAAASS